MRVFSFLFCFLLSVDGISVNPEVLARPNPLLVINGRANLNHPPARRAANGSTSATEVNSNQVIVGPSDIPDTGAPISIRCNVSVTTP